MRRGLSQEELAKLLNVEAGSVGNWEAGRNNPKISRMKEIAEKLGVSVEFLMGEDPRAAESRQVGPYPGPVIHGDDFTARDQMRGPSKDACMDYLADFL